MNQPIARERGLIAALDTPDLAVAQGLAAAVAPHCAMLKLGLEFFAACGPAGVAAIAGRPIFLDLKLNDIPNTVLKTTLSLVRLRPALLTLHAGGGAAMMAAARKAVERSGSSTRLLGVTVLTSLDGDALGSVGVGGSVAAQVVRLARLAVAAGAHGVVCSAHEVAAVREAVGDGPLLVVPGIRPAGSATDDQARVMTPAAAMAAGADYLVVGRPITGAAEPAAAAAAMAAQMA